MHSGALSEYWLSREYETMHKAHSIPGNPECTCLGQPWLGIVLELHFDHVDVASRPATLTLSSQSRNYGLAFSISATEMFSPAVDVAPVPQLLRPTAFLPLIPCATFFEPWKLSRQTVQSRLSKFWYLLGLSTIRSSPSFLRQRRSGASSASILNAVPPRFRQAPDVFFGRALRVKPCHSP